MNSQSPASRSKLASKDDDRRAHPASNRSAEFIPLQRDIRLAAVSTRKRNEFRAPSAVASSRCVTRPAEQGVALVVTLILLSVITFLAITFLVISNRERGSVTSTSNQTDARLAADNATERAKAEIIAPILAFTNQFSYDMSVSTNFINAQGFLAANGASLTNVSYQYLNGSPLNANDSLQNIANLLFNSRPPVFITNRLVAPAGSNEFRFYLDLNRNGRFDPSGWLPVINPSGGYYDLSGNPIAAIVSGNTLSNYFIGDPQWIGILERPQLPHSPTNKYIARYAYIVVPIGKALDINAIHNQAKQLGITVDGFLRNQGFGPWEDNLAALLVDLNTNQWLLPPNTPYNYATNAFSSSGSAFEDALSLVRYRYAGNYGNLSNVLAWYGAIAAASFASDGIDGYSDGTLMTGTAQLPTFDGDQPKKPWSGAPNPNHFFTTQDLFDKNKTSFGAPAVYGFSDRLRAAGTNNSSYDQYTYYRLLSVLDTDSAPEPPGKMHLNYDNLARSNTVTGALSATNFYAWRPLEFFTNAADKLLRQAFGNASNSLYYRQFSVTNIPIYPTNGYTPSVHRLLQLAANLYDATTNRSDTIYPHLPSVFRPIFGTQGTNVYIAGFDEVTNLNVLSATMRDLSDTSIMPYDMVYGIPLVIGAKKGFPNFNEFSMQNAMLVSRRLQFRRQNPNDSSSPVNETNQMYVVSMTNVFGVEAWNSYSNKFPRDLRMTVITDMSMVITNLLGPAGSILRSNYYSTNAVINVPANAWAGFSHPDYAKASFRIPLTNGITFLPDSKYLHAPQNSLVPLALDNRFQRNTGFPVPRWGLNLNTRVRFILVDVAAQRIVDYVNLNSAENNTNTVDVTDTMMAGASFGDPIYDPNPGGQWNTNRQNASASIFAPTDGIINQILACKGQIPGIDWNNFSLDPGAGRTKEKAIDGFRKQFDLGPLSYAGDIYSKSNIFYAPLVPFRIIHQPIVWQANDPLVHYTAGDLTDLTRTNVYIDSNPLQPPSNLGVINDRYEPWGGNPGGKSESPTRYDLAVKDPLVRRSEDWEFPTNKLPNIGWIGRVHRGTPWQTIYLKSASIDFDGWRKWSGNVREDFILSHPTNDWAAFDLFTVAPNENATLGQLSINQANLAAWSAVFGGVIALTNSMTDDQVNGLAANIPALMPAYEPRVIEPVGIGGTNSPLQRLVDGINRTRGSLQFGGSFKRLGDILSVPEFTTNSPFLNLSADQRLLGISDAVYERLPQQVLSLLRGGEQPRFAVYAYGQSLKPADKSIVTRGNYIGMCTNYQITGEAAIRTVVRVAGSPDPETANPLSPKYQSDPDKRYPLRTLVDGFNPLPPE